ncbi:MAG TPA: CRTAC1 family protein [Thermoanaerobaculia bacterium]
MKVATIALSLAVAHALALAAEEDPEAPLRLLAPPDDVGIATLAARAEAQRAAADRITAFHDFRFTDRREESGITFVHRVVDDAAKSWKPAHYDHGTGIVAADVDGDDLYDLYFVNQLGGNELWKNLGGGRFRDVTAEAGVGLAGRIGVTASFADVDNDGDPDLFVTTVLHGNALFANDGQGRFTDVTEAAGLAYSGHSSAAVFFDFDRDGWLDLFLANVGKYTYDERGEGGYFRAYSDAFQGHLKPERTESSILYRNASGLRFEDVSARVGLRDGSWSGDAVFHDLDRDGYPELYVLNMQGDDHFYVNERGERFVDRTAERFPKTPFGTMGAKFFDHDNDGRFDLLLTDMHSDMSHNVGPEEETRKSDMRWPEEILGDSSNNIFGNAFYEGTADGGFRERSDELGLENYWPWGVSVDDLNADGFDDVLITSSMNFPFRYGINSLLLNQGGKGFAAAEFVLGVEPRADGAARTQWFTLDCGGEDLGHSICRGRKVRTVEVWGALGSRSAVIFDLDGDGDLDIVTNEHGAAPQVLVSDLAQRRRPSFLALRLRGTRSNRQGLGAVVEVTAGGRRIVKCLDGKSGYLSQSALPLYVGLGEASSVERLEVLWPSGVRQVVTNPPLGQLLDLEEPGAADGG